MRLYTHSQDEALKAAGATLDRVVRRLWQRRHAQANFRMVRI